MLLTWRWKVQEQEQEYNQFLIPSFSFAEQRWKNTQEAFAVEETLYLPWDNCEIIEY